MGKKEERMKEKDDYDNYIVLILYISICENKYVSEAIMSKYLSEFGRM